MFVLGLTGRAGAGKTTVAQHLLMGHNWIGYGFANPLKGGVMAMFGADVEQIEDRKQKELALPVVDRSPRFLLQELGGWARETLGDDIWVRIARHIIDAAVRSPELAYAPALVVTDVRYENEADFIRDELGGVILHIERPGNPFTGQVREHASEAGIKLKAGDLVLRNMGTVDELLAELDVLVEGLRDQIDTRQAARVAALGERVELDSGSLPADWDKECQP